MAFLSDASHVLEAIIPLYIPVMLAYISVKWFKLFTPNQCSGIDKFVGKFSVPLLSFEVVSQNNPYKMDLKIVFADFLAKFMTVIVLVVIVNIISSKSRGTDSKLSWFITGLSLSTLPNTLIIGIPVLKALYGVDAQVFQNQIVMLQCLIWYSLLLLLFEFNAAAAAKSSPPPPPPADLRFIGEMEDKKETTIVKEEEETATTTGTAIATRDESRKWVKIMLILSKTGKKIIMNPNTYATLLGLIWASVHFRWGVKLPDVIDKSIKILSEGGLGMALFSLGLFMASQESIIACGMKKAALGFVLKFLAGPAIMALCSFAVGMKGSLFQISIMQAAISQGIIPFVFATEYNVHPDILSTSVILGLLVTLPITLAYFYLLALL